MPDLNKERSVKKVVAYKKFERDFNDCLVKSDLIRRLRISRILEEQLGSPLLILQEYDHFMGNKMASSRQMGIHIHLALSDSGMPDVLDLHARISPPVEVTDTYDVDLTWDIPKNWLKSRAKGFRLAPLKKSSILSSQVKIQSPGADYPLGNVTFRAKIALHSGKRKFLFFPEVSLDLSSIPLPITDLRKV
ncbi:hypothetical protein JW926_08545 [Candidatus Sumerlaeota bacterium]|nr:hypothetical protein [Candidatus Sumerlaeota bacterium]